MDRHGMWPEDKAKQYAVQNGLCYLCKRPLKKLGSRQVHIDHDQSHCEAGSSCSICRRGLAHAHCNTAIGLLCEDPALIRLVADNLEREQAEVDERKAAQAEQQDVLFAS